MSTTARTLDFEKMDGESTVTDQCISFYVGTGRDERDSWLEVLQQLLSRDETRNNSTHLVASEVVGLWRLPATVVLVPQPDIGSSSETMENDSCIVQSPYQHDKSDIRPGDQYSVRLAPNTTLGVEFEVVPNTEQVQCVVSFIIPSTMSSIKPPQARKGDRILALAGVAISDRESFAAAATAMKSSTDAYVDLRLLCRTAYLPGHSQRDDGQNVGENGAR